MGADERQLVVYRISPSNSAADEAAVPGLRVCLPEAEELLNARQSGLEGCYCCLMSMSH